jgi:hypothetical protein
VHEILVVIHLERSLGGVDHLPHHDGGYLHGVDHQILCDTLPGRPVSPYKKKQQRQAIVKAA